MALSQTRINEFLSDNANKDKTWPSAPFSPDAKKTSNLSFQVEKVSLIKESVSEAEGTAKVAWSVGCCSCPDLFRFFFYLLQNKRLPKKNQEYKV